MDDGVAYMVMGEGGEGGQPTQVVAVDNGDGTQQLVGFLAEKLILPTRLSGNTSNGPGDRARDLHDYRPPGAQSTYLQLKFMCFQLHSIFAVSTGIGIKRVKGVQIPKPCFLRWHRALLRAGEDNSSS